MLVLPMGGSQENVTKAKARGVKRVVLNKPVGLSLQAMGVKGKTFEQLKDFRAGKATWKGFDGFKAYVWSSVLSHNLVVF